MPCTNPVNTRALSFFPVREGSQEGKLESQLPIVTSSFGDEVEDEKPIPRLLNKIAYYIERIATYISPLTSQIR